MNKSSFYTILAIGFAKWRGCDPRALAQSFRSSGHSLVEIDAEDYVPWRWSSFFSKVLRRLFLKSLVTDYNNEIKRIAESACYDFILVFKGKYLKPETLEYLRKLGKPVYNFYPDVSFSDHGELILNSLGLYDCIFSAKSFHGINEIRKFNIRDLVLVRHGYDPEVHRPVAMMPNQMDYYKCDVSFIGCWSPEKEHLISHILNNRPNLKVVVFGIGWHYATPEFVKVMGKNLRAGVFGDELAFVYRASKVNLGLLSCAAGDPSMSDQTTARTFQIPASRSFMLHMDTPEVRTYFEPDKEIVLFKNEDDLLVQLDRALSDEKFREIIADGGYSRCTGAPYDYSSAVEIILQYFTRNQ